MTADKLVDMLLARLVRDHGRSQHHWFKAIGTILLYNRGTHPHCNWAITPIGSIEGITIIESLLATTIPADQRIAPPQLHGQPMSAFLTFPLGIRRSAKSQPLPKTGPAVQPHS